ncbi:MAG: hypothetical protein MI808_19690 [Pseudomonadales bacterium]|nr:hypothetical protein [Pseudomonadales bacterium]
MKKGAIISSVLALALSGCANIQDGEYLGGFVRVKGFDSNKQGQPAASSSHESEQVAVSRDDSKPQQERDLSAKANAQGVCWIGCKSNDPSPMESIEFSLSAIDVDTAYTRIKREFNFKTRAERIEADPNVEGWLDGTLDFRYQATPGVNYTMRGYREHKFNTEETPNTIQVEIFKDGADQVFIKASFYSGNTKDLEGYKSSLRQRIIKAAKG